MTDAPDWTAALADARRMVENQIGLHGWAVNAARCILAAQDERERLTGEVARLTEALDAPLDSAEAFEARIRADERSRAERDIAAAIERMSARRGDRTGSLYLAGVWVLASDYPKARPAAPRPTESSTVVVRRGGDDDSQAGAA